MNRTGNINNNYILFIFFVGVIGILIILICVPSVSGKTVIIDQFQYDLDELPTENTRYVCEIRAESKTEKLIKEKVKEKYCLIFHTTDITQPYDKDNFHYMVLRIPEYQYMVISNKRIIEGVFDDIRIKSGVWLNAPNPYYGIPKTKIMPNKITGNNIIINEILKSPNYILLDVVYIPVMNDYAEFDTSVDIFKLTHNMDYSYLDTNFFADMPSCERTGADHLLSPTRGSFSAKSDISEINDYIDKTDDFVLNEANSVTKRNSVASVLAMQAYAFITPINCLHENDAARANLVKNIPSKLYFYMIAASYLNIGTGYISATRDIQVFQSYPSTQKFILDEYKKVSGDVLKDAYRYKDLPIFLDFVYALSSKGELSRLISYTDAATQDYYISTLINISQTYHANPILMLTYRRANSNDYQNKIALKELNKLFGDKKTFDLTKTILLRELSDKTAADIGSYLQYFLLTNKGDFTSGELGQLKNLYNSANNTFVGFDEKVLKVYGESQYIPIEEMIDNVSGKYYLRGSMFFGSPSREQMYDYDNFILTATNIGFTSTKVPDQYYNKNVKPINTQATKLTKIMDVSFKDMDGNTRTYNGLTIEIMVYPRPAVEYDPLTPMIFTRGHVSDSAESAFTLLSNDVSNNRPLLIHLSGCSESSFAQDLIGEYPNKRIYISATSGTGTQYVNDPWIFTLIDSITKEGITNVDKQAEYLRGVLEKRGISKNPNYQYYMTSSEFMYDKLAMPKKERVVVRFTFWDKLKIAGNTFLNTPGVLLK